MQWRLDNGEWLGLAGLITLLKPRAAKLVAANPQTVHGVEAIGIDFPNPREEAGL